MDERPEPGVKTATLRSEVAAPIRTAAVDARSVDLLRELAVANRERLYHAATASSVPACRASTATGSRACHHDCSSSHGMAFAYR